MTFDSTGCFDLWRGPVAFRMSGRQVGPMSTSAGELAPTGQPLSLRVIDVLTRADRRISSLWTAADELGALSAVGAARLLGAPTD